MAMMRNRLKSMQTQQFDSISEVNHQWNMQSTNRTNAQNWSSSVTCFNFNWIVYGLFNLICFTSVASTYYSLTVAATAVVSVALILFVPFALSLISILICSFLFRFVSFSTFAKRWSRFQCCVFDRRSFLLRDFVSEFFLFNLSHLRYCQYQYVYQLPVKYLSRVFLPEWK